MLSQYLSRFSAILKRHLFISLWSVVTILMVVIITQTHPEISWFSIEFSARGIDKMVKVYRVPLYFFASGIPIYTLLFAYRRMEQIDKQLLIADKQFSQSLKQYNLNDKQFRSASAKNRIDTWISVFFKLIDIHKINVQNIQNGKHTDIKALSKFINDLINPFRNIFQLNQNSYSNDKEKKIAFRKVVNNTIHSDIKNSLGVFVAHLEIILEHCSKYPTGIDGEKYYSIFISQLSEVEKKVILTYVLYSDKFEIVVTKKFYHNMFDSLKQDEFTSHLLNELKNESRVGNS